MIGIRVAAAGLLALAVGPAPATASVATTASVPATAASLAAPGIVVRAAAASLAAPAPVVYAAPVPPPLDVVHPFDPPATPYGPGHLGVDLAVSPGQAVRSAAEGTVSFAGSVAGRGVVVVAHPDGISTEYEPVDPVVSVGQQVSRGQVLGRVDGTHDDCAPGRCLHWGARRGGQYLDPLSLLHPLGPVRLLPWPAGTADP